MTVRELMAALEGHDPDAPVIIADGQAYTDVHLLTLDVVPFGDGWRERWGGLDGVDAVAVMAR